MEGSPRADPLDRCPSRESLDLRRVDSRSSTDSRRSYDRRLLTSPTSTRSSTSSYRREQISVDVAIIGGGPGGLAAANAIHIANPALTIKIFEKVKDFRPVGNRAVVTENGFAALQSIAPRIAERVAKDLIPPQSFSLHDVDGSMVGTMPLGEVQVGSRKVRTGSIAWYKLRDALAESLPPGTLKLGYALEKLKLEEHGVLMKFAFHSTLVHAKILIGCDGNFSRVRQYIFRDGPPKFLNTVIWRGVVETPDDWPYPQRGRHLWASEDSGTKLNVGPLDDTKLGWQCFAPMENDKLSMLISERYQIAKKARCLGKLDGSWPEFIRNLIRQTDLDQITEHGQVFRESYNCQKWGKGCISLLGDAAHVMTAFLGQGANQAFGDAVELGRAIKEMGPNKFALRKYESSRIPHATRVQDGSVSVAKWVLFGEGPEMSEEQWFEQNDWCRGWKPKPILDLSFGTAENSGPVRIRAINPKLEA